MRGFVETKRTAYICILAEFVAITALWDHALIERYVNIGTRKDSVMNGNKREYAPAEKYADSVIPLKRSKPIF